MLAVGVQTWGTDVPALERYWKAADDLGYARITYGDGLGAWTHDGWTMLGALAVLTRRARIGPAVTYAFDASSHHPSWLAKRAVAVDHLSGGRLDLRLAVGAEDPATAEGWRAHGISYPAAATRIDVLEESIHVVRGLWQAPGGIDHEGRRYALRRARLGSEPVQRGGPPIWIAAMGPRALALTARCADGWEASYQSPADFATRWQRLSTLLRAAGRTEDGFARSVELDAIAIEGGGPLDAWLDRFRAARGIERGHPLLDTVLAGDGPALVERIARYETAGATDLMLGFADFPATGMLETFAATALHGRPASTPSPARRS
jgi:alkanesulfonate monooxygenase SsuD/methylene tetrahydromethanopterin reductase-like flavin-dependent oxidoreductase (luciferase family)